MNPLTSILNTTAERFDESVVDDFVPFTKDGKSVITLDKCVELKALIRAEQLRLLEAVKKIAEGMKLDKYDCDEGNIEEMIPYNQALSDIISALSLNEKDV